MISFAGKNAPDTFKPFGSASVGTAISAAWTPGSSKYIRLMGGWLNLLSSGTIQIDLTDGTVNAASTIATFGLKDNDAAHLFYLGAGKTLASADFPLGIKARAGAGSIVATFFGRETS